MAYESYSPEELGNGELYSRPKDAEIFLHTESDLS